MNYSDLNNALLQYRSNPSLVSAEDLLELKDALRRYRFNPFDVFNNTVTDVINAAEHVVNNAKEIEK